MGGQDTRPCTGRGLDAPRVQPARVGTRDVSDRESEDADPTSEVSSPKLRLEIGRLVEGRLRIVRLLGRGGMSEVYEAYDERAGRRVAVKLMLTDQCKDAQQAIFAEARSLVRFCHPHVVRFYGVGAIERQPFIELESAPGGSLAERIESSGTPPVADALDLLAKVADGLAALHEVGIVHRDIKADNVLLTAEGRPVIADFGLAMSAEDMPMLPSGIIGTPAYMAPEAILGITESFEQYAAADQYSLGVTAYYALTGTLPFEAPTPSALFYAQMAVEPDAPSRRRVGLSPEIDALVLRALAKRPADRFPNLRAMHHALLDAHDATAPSVPLSSEPLRESGTRSVRAPALKPTVVAV